jgi:hypothetical protein
MAININMNNFVIDRILRAVGKSKDGDVLFAINQVTNPSLSVTSETSEAVDALGSRIAVFNRAKSCEFSAENALFDMALMAQQAGSKEGVVRGEVKAVPAFDPMDEGKLAHTPINADAIKIYELNGDGSFGAEIKKSIDGGADGGYVLEGINVTLPEGKNGIAVYEYDAEKAVSVVNSATEFPKACQLVLEVLGCDVCNQEELIYAYLIFPNFKISPDFDWSLATDGTHPFSGMAMQNYCDEKKELYKLVIVD